MRARHLAVALLSVGCAHVANLAVTPSGADIHPERRPANCHIDFYRTKSPDRPYDEIATLHFNGVMPIGPTEAQERMRAEACRLGAHGVVVTRDYTLSMMTGTAVVYRGAVAKDAGQPDPPDYDPLRKPPVAPQPEAWMKRFCAREMDPVAARVRSATILRDGPEATDTFVTYVDTDAVVCAAARATGLFRKVVLSDGRSGYLADAALELGKPPAAPPASKPAAPRKEPTKEGEKLERLDPRAM